MGQYRKVIDKTGHFVSGEWKIDCQGYAHVLVIKAYAYHGTQYRKPTYYQKLTPCMKA